MTYNSAAFVLGAALCSVGIVSILYVLRIYRVNRLKSRRGEALTMMTVIGVFLLLFTAVLYIRRNPQLGYSVAGCVSKGQMPGGQKRLGTYEDLGAILDAHDYDELIIALESHEVEFMPGVLASAGIRMSLILFFNDYIPSQLSIDIVDRTRLIDMRVTPLAHLGWAPVHGLRGDTSIEERVKYDIRILLMTAFGGMVNSEQM